MANHSDILGIAICDCYHTVDCSKLKRNPVSCRNETLQITCLYLENNKVAGSQISLSSKCSISNLSISF